MKRSGRSESESEEPSESPKICWPVVISALIEAACASAGSGLRGDRSFLLLVVVVGGVSERLLSASFVLGLGVRLRYGAALDLVVRAAAGIPRVGVILGLGS